MWMPGNTISGWPPGMYILAPMARNSFLFASMSFEAMCQWPMVTPISLNGAGCAATYPAASVDANTKAAITLIFTESLPVLSWDGDACTAISPAPRYHGQRPAEPGFPRAPRDAPSLGNPHGFVLFTGSTVAPCPRPTDNAGSGVTTRAEASQALVAFREGWVHPKVVRTLR